MKINDPIEMFNARLQSQEWTKVMTDEEFEECRRVYLESGPPPPITKMESKFYTHVGQDFFYDGDIPYLMEMNEMGFRSVEEGMVSKWESDEYNFNLFNKAIANGKWIERENPWAK